MEEVASEEEKSEEQVGEQERPVCVTARHTCWVSRAIGGEALQLTHMFGPTAGGGETIPNSLNEVRILQQCEPRSPPIVQSYHSAWAPRPRDLGRGGSKFSRE